MTGKRNGVDQLTLCLWRRSVFRKPRNQLNDPIHFTNVRVGGYPVRQFYEVGKCKHRRLLCLTSEQNFI
jgi:hypothetical protein